MFFPLFILFSLGFLSFSFFSLSIKLHVKSRKFPPIYGPSSYPIIGCLISFYKNRHRLLDWYTNLLSNSPTQTILVHRFGAPRTIITANANNVEHILKTNFTNYPKGKPFTEILGDFLGVGIFNVDGELWNMQRKLASHEFSTKSLREFVVKTLEEEVERRLIPLLEAAAECGTVLDLQDVLRRFAFDTICKVSLGIDLHFLDFSQYSHVPPLAEAFDNASHACAMRGMAPIYFVWKIKKVLNLGSERKLKENVKIVHDCINEIITIKKRKIHENGDKGHDLLSRLLMMNLEDDVVRDMVISFLMAGRDTTSSALTWLFWLLTKHRNIEKEILHEIMSIKNENTDDMNYDQLKEMKYLQACLCESMRLYPPVAWDSKHAEKDDILPDGARVYKGNRVTYFQYGMGRMEELWGKDRLEFKPERWFDENGELKLESLYKFPVFQAGPRVCLGKEMALIQMKYVLAAVLRRFEIRPVNLEKPVFVPLLTAYMAGGFNVRICNRGT